MPSPTEQTSFPPWIMALFDILSDAIVGLDEGGRVRFLNRAAAQLAGREETPAAGCLLRDLLPLVDEVTQEPFPPPERRDARQAHDPRPAPHQRSPADPAAASSPSSLDPARRADPIPLSDPRNTRRRRVRIAGDPEDRVIEAVLLRFAKVAGDSTTALLVLRDRSAQLRAERALRESEERYRAFLAQSSEGIWRGELTAPLAIDLPEDQQIDAFYRDGVLAEGNLVISRMVGLADPCELIGMQLGDLLPRTDPDNLELLRSFIHSAYRLNGAESHAVDREGHPKHFLNNVTGVVEEGHLIGAWGTLVDLTEQKRREQELRSKADELQAADRRKNQFLAMMAHELRNPLAPIRNSVELMRQVESADPAFHSLRAMVERQVQHLARVVDDLLDVSRINDGSIHLRKEAIDLRQVVERAVDAVRPLIETRGHLLSLRLPPQAVRLEADPARVEQVISNLLNNAAKYTMPEGQIWLSLEADAQEAAIKVRDSGVGVPPDVLSRIFEPFAQTDGTLARSAGGLGIGLSLVRSLVEMHGGSVEAHSRGLGQGSEFTVRLPIRAAAAADGTGEAGAAIAAGEDDGRAAGGLRVMVVEDNVDAAESLASLLRLWNHQVSVVRDGHAAVELARAERPQVVLLDIGLPGLDGYQVARRLRHEIGLHETLLVAMTGYGQPEDRRLSREAGIQYHFVKPLEPAVLRSLLANLPAAAVR